MLRERKRSNEERGSENWEKKERGREIGAWKNFMARIEKRKSFFPEHKAEMKISFAVVYINCEYIPNIGENWNDSSSLNMAIEVRWGKNFHGEESVWKRQ